jgi:hypothetical protein
MAPAEKTTIAITESTMFFTIGLAPFRLPLPSAFTLQRQFPSNAQQPSKNPSKDLSAANKKIRIFRSASSIVGPEKTLFHQNRGTGLKFFAGESNCAPDGGF